ncbi:MAG TPA: 1,6-anhydro-N-acetylmuramyl-L-alanine amidase AmpD [Burkholderiales bacterium]|nr:1,6-anhydro-N-acetylmuramyl-L-alanine amidase AmpD [Burkholderiales bacterium]
MRFGADGLAAGARYVASPNCDSRPQGEAVTLLVVHSISLPPRTYGGPGIERLFTNRIDPAEHPYYAQVAQLRVSAHLLLRRNGELVQFVPLHLRAWHAGDSTWRGRRGCNDFSIGVELEGSDTDSYADAQYARLVQVTRALRAVLPLRDVAAHSDIAPLRKTDPGALFDWTRFLSALARR